ncbi:MAG TPA: hypothetical protein VNC50_21850, partial [Planctomycetia bacterium]|nr:hypothetical protein [Planctomycetia bacterium]
VLANRLPEAADGPRADLKERLKLLSAEPKGATQIDMILDAKYVKVPGEINSPDRLGGMVRILDSRRKLNPPDFQKWCRETAAVLKGG